MAKVALRAYNNEIEGLIERGQRLDEAVAHCLHILKTYPKHLETYRLLGKAYLEAKRYDQAVDIFQRVLVAAPEDFVSHVGMSIIADDQGRLDEAIWHMERAFEVQPSNAAIQGELQRLFGRRDGVEPPKIRLTRGALAHMYVQGELYGQAISEIRAVLGQDPKRTDLQVLLATAHYRNGQKTEAADSCADLLGRFPYCLDANRLMVEILPGTQRAEAALDYRQRVNELDPYAAFAQGSVFDTETVAGSAVSLERLEYTGQATNIDAVLGLGLESASAVGGRDARQPAWLASAKHPTQTKTGVPDFLREAGWSTADPAHEEKAASEKPEREFVPAAVPGELPAWVKALAPAEDSEATSELPEGTPDWLRFDVGAESSVSAPGSTEAADARSTEWLEDAGAVPGDRLAAATAIGSEGTSSGSGSKEDSAHQSEASGSEVPAAWPNGPVSASETAAQLDESGSNRPALSQQLSSAPGNLGSLGTTAEERDDAMAWLESLAAKHGAKAEELVTNADGRSDSAPGWVEKAREIGEQGPDSWASLRSAAFNQSSANGGNGSDIWLTPEAEQRQVADLQPHADTGPAGKRQPFDWIGGLSDKDASRASDSDNDVQAATFAQRGEAPEAPRTTVPPLIGDEPSWLGTDLSPSGGSELAGPSTPLGSSVDLPDWLAGLDKEMPAAHVASGPADELPAWLQPEAEAGPSVVQPAGPTDWQPVKSQTQMDASSPESSAMPVASGKAAGAGPPPSEMQAPVSADARLKSVQMLPKGVGASLGSAQAELGRGNIAAALDLYGRLIRKGKSLEEIIRDLRDALYRYPVEVPILQALGDAYMRGNRLQEALDAYTKAEELLR